MLTSACAGSTTPTFGDCPITLPAVALTPFFALTGPTTQSAARTSFFATFSFLPFSLGVTQ
jgi:hypothetical protein